MKGQDEDHGLLDDRLEAQSTPISNQNEKSFGARRRTRSLWIACLGLFMLLLIVLALPSFRSFKKSLPPTATSKTTPQLAIPLHPEQHNARKPKTLTFHWSVTQGIRAPDGVQKEVYLVNGQFPGPVIEARSGDRVMVHVHNHLDADGVSFHWHGLRLRGHNAMDGAAGYTQCPIPSGGNFVYDFQIGNDEYGTFWWHSHVHVQRGEGLFGGLVVHKPQEDLAGAGAAEDEVLLLVGDWFHRKQKDVLAWYDDAGSFGNEPVPDSLLINGHGRYDCSMAVPARPVECNQIGLGDMVPLLLHKPATRTRLRVVNTGTIAGLTMMVDGATLQPLGVDGGCDVDAEPAESVGILYPGERADFLLDWRPEHAKDPWLNIYLDKENFIYQNRALNPNQAFPLLPSTLLAADRREAPALNTGNSSHQDLTTLSASTTAPTPVTPVGPEETILFYVKTQKMSHLQNRPVGFINHTYWQPQTPPLLSLNRSSWDSHQRVEFIKLGSRVKLVINNLDDGAHPFHMHGYTFDVLSSFRASGRDDGFGSYNPYQNPEQGPPNPLNPLKNPLRKDTIAIPRRGHAVLSFTADNPGLWMLHCHMMVHLGTGMAAGVHVGSSADHVQEVNGSAAQLCQAAG